jgi:hypothetical protein
MNLREAAQKALTALEHHAMQRTYAGGVYISNAAIALRAALAQKQEPVAWQAVGGSIWGHKTSEDDRPLYTEDRNAWNEGYKHGLWQGQNCAQPMSQHQKEYNDSSMAFYFNDYRKEQAAMQVAQAVPATPADMAIYQAIADNYTHPQPVPLTDSEIDAITRELFGQQIGAMMGVHRLHARAVLFAAGIVPAPTTGEGQ